MTAHTLVRETQAVMTTPRRRQETRKRAPALLHTRPVTLCIVAAALACGGDQLTVPGTAIDVTGTWSYFETMTNTSQQIACEDYGLLVISQDGAQFEATVNQAGYCTSPGGGFDNSSSGTTHGTATDSGISFQVGPCDHHGRFSNTPADSAAGPVTCRIQSGNQSVTFAGNWFAVKGVELSPPSIADSIGLSVSDVLLVPLDTLRVVVTASDDRKLHWIGWRIGPPANIQDSILVEAPDTTHTFSIVASPTWIGQPVVTAFARDGLGRSRETRGDSILVIDAIRRSFRTVALSALASDLAYDAGRNLLYLLQGEAGRIGVLDLSTFALGTLTSIPGPPPTSRGLRMDIAPSGDTLITPIATPGIAFVNLVTGAIDTVHITSDVGVTTYIQETHTTIGSKVFSFGGWSDDAAGISGEALFEYDIAHDSVTRRTDTGINGNVGGISDRARSGDWSRLLQLDKNRGCGQIYDASTNAFSACVAFAFPSYARASGTYTGDRWLVGSIVIDGLLNIVASLDPSLSDGGIAPDGGSAYFPTSYGYLKVQLLDGTVLEKVRIPVSVTRVTALPDGRRVVLWSDPGSTSERTNTDQVTIVDVTATGRATRVESARH
jgi:hypothetical protein